MEKIALYGGAFNPIHNGHMHLCDEFIKKLELDRLILMPTAQSPHKTSDCVASGADRFAMCMLAAEGQKKISVSDMEISRGGKSYTVDTLRALKKSHPGACLYLIMGADMFMTLESWRAFREIFTLAVICTAPRDGCGQEALRRKAAALEALGAQIIVADIPPAAVSSTQIRERLRAMQPVDGLVPEPVARYIAQHRLYHIDTEGCDTNAPVQ